MGNWVLNNRSVGAAMEDKAAAYLMSQGYRILDRNFRCKIGEIDIIGEEDNNLCFVEVKYRKDRYFQGSAEAAVNIHKQCKICKTSDYYRMVKHISPDRNIRFDVVAIYGEDVYLYRNAFPYIAM
ncbi:MAG: YraN family protein [Lachnospiraceae bacterium]|nr:YraN family protein [Lachnospiraceae bacterium]